MNYIEAVSRYLCTSLGYAPDEEVCSTANPPAIGPMGHVVIPDQRCKGWEVYALIVREVLLHAREASEAIDAMANEHVDPACTPESLWHAGCDALITTANVPDEIMFCDREDRNFGLGNEVEAPDRDWKTARGLE